MIDHSAADAAQTVLSRTSRDFSIFFFAWMAVMGVLIMKLDRVFDTARERGATGAMVTFALGMLALFAATYWAWMLIFPMVLS